MYLLQNMAKKKSKIGITEEKTHIFSSFLINEYIALFFWVFKVLVLNV